MNNRDRIGADAGSGNSVAIRTPGSVWSIQSYLSAQSGSAEICRPSQQLANSWGICRELAPEQVHIRSYEPTGKRLTDLATTESAVVSYFDQFLWSTEKAEWEKLSAQEKRQFIDRLDAVKGTPIVVVPDSGQARHKLYT